MINMVLTMFAALLQLALLNDQPDKTYTQPRVLATLERAEKQIIHWLSQLRDPRQRDSSSSSSSSSSGGERFMCVCAYACVLACTCE